MSKGESRELLSCFVGSSKPFAKGIAFECDLVRAVPARELRRWSASRLDQVHAALMVESADKVREFNAGRRLALTLLRRK